MRYLLSIILGIMVAKLLLPITNQPILVASSGLAVAAATIFLYEKIFDE